MSAYRVQAYNTAHSSENKIHDDSVARRFGFSGALVPGVDVYAYMMHLPVERWGRDSSSAGARNAASPALSMTGRWPRWPGAPTATRSRSK